MTVVPPLTRRRPGAAAAAAFAAVLAVALVGLPARPAGAHAGDGLTQAILEQVSPATPGITMQVAYSVNYELLVANHSQQVVTFLADSGEPFLQIGPTGVQGNFASPTFYASDVPEGLTQFPAQARPGADVPPIWRTLSAQPNWGWYDHRLHPTASSVPPEIIKADKPAVLGTWRIPFRLGPQAGEVRGRFEFRPPTGAYTPVQKSPLTPADGVKVQVVPSPTVPAIFVENLSGEPVVVLGKDGEPFARIGPKVTEVNTKSPVWAEIEQARGHDPSDEADSTAAPVWRQVADTPRWSWPEFRAAAPKSDPPQAVVARGKTVTVKNWSIPYLIGDRRAAVDGVTQWVPIAELRKRAAGPTGSGRGSHVGLYAALAAAAAALGAGAWLITSMVRNRSRTAAKGEPWTS